MADFEVPRRTLDIIKFADERLVLDTQEQELYADEQHVPLAPIMYDIVDLLAHNLDVYVPKERLIQSIWGITSGYVLKNHEDSLKVHVNMLRHRLGKEDLGHPEKGGIRSRRYSGYIALTHLNTH